MTTIMKYNRNIIRFLTAFMALSLMACHDDDNTLSNTNEEDANYVGKAVGNFSADEWYPGGKLGTTDNVAAGCYEDETPAVENQGLMKEFKLGEASLNVPTQPIPHLLKDWVLRICVLHVSIAILDMAMANDRHPISLFSVMDTC